MGFFDRLTSPQALSGAAAGAAIGGAFGGDPNAPRTAGALSNVASLAQQREQFSQGAGMKQADADWQRLTDILPWIDEKERMPALQRYYNKYPNEVMQNIRGMLTQPAGRPLSSSQYKTQLIQQMGGTPEEQLARLDAGKKIEVGVDLGLQGATKGQLEKDMFSAQQRLDRFDYIEKLYDPEYLTYAGRGKKWLLDKASKAGMSTEKMDQFLADYSQWEALAKQESVTFRKEMTGVAGRPEEFADIARGTIDPDKDSPASFPSKLKLQQEVTAKAIAKMQAYRIAGIPWNEQTRNLVSWKKLPSDPAMSDIKELAQELKSQMGGAGAFGGLGRESDEASALSEEQLMQIIQSGR